ncbi:sulfotransferase [Anabaena sp. UHCC 0451]|uniref:sulfotransferase family protein n=1 Tax=Anabaena sp. UHCC 0451 TaxID=2055235 RepID=UPI002B200A8F|nr:sulfotransferase [Anabaena sp. UHCC 0451]MEA5575035.1 sulfotransferase [Anabaena sp. UHCC 0451]
MKTLSSSLKINQIQLPNFLGIGSERCASTWLHYVLSKHPQLYLPERKEFNFWSGTITKEKLEEYLKNFEHEKANACLLGEISPTYAAMYSEEVALLKEVIPELKVIFIIRNPVDRLISSITRQWTFFYVDKGASTNRNLFFLLRCVDKGLSRRLTDYLRTYQIWSKCLGKDHVFLEKFENLSSNPQGFLIRVLEFLGVQPIIDESVMNSKRNKSNEDVKTEIPEFLKWYMAVEWLPKVKQMAIILPLDLSDWIENLEFIVGKNKFNIKFWFIYIVHKIYFYIPYSLLYSLAKYFQVQMKVAKTRRDLGL